MLFGVVMLQLIPLFDGKGTPQGERKQVFLGICICETARQVAVSNDELSPGVSQIHKPGDQLTPSCGRKGALLQAWLKDGLSGTTLQISFALQVQILYFSLGVLAVLASNCTLALRTEKNRGVKSRINAASHRPVVGYSHTSNIGTLKTITQTKIQH